MICSSIMQKDDVCVLEFRRMQSFDCKISTNDINDCIVIAIGGNGGGVAKLELPADYAEHVAECLANYFGYRKGLPALEAAKHLSSKDLIAELAERAATGRLD